MRLSKMWGDFEKALMQSPANLVQDILYSAALKKKLEIETYDGMELNDLFVKRLIGLATKRRSPQEQLKFIKNYTKSEDD